MIAHTKDEVEILREGGRRLARHVKALSQLVKPGMTPRQLEDAAREMVEKEGDQLAFYAYPSGRRGEKFMGGLCVSVNDVMVHGPAFMHDEPIEDGDIVSLDFGIKHKGLYTDHAVSVIAGEKRDPHDEELLRGTKEALAAGIKEARVGNTVGDIGFAVEQVAKKYGFGYPRNLSGHGVGKKIHEEPHVPNFGRKGEGEVLEEGLVIAIEPMMALGSGDLFVDKDAFSYRTKDGSRTAHFEHTIIVATDGPEILTKE